MARDTRADAMRIDDAVNRADLDEVRQLLDEGVDPDCRDVTGATPLMNASWVGAVAIVELLLSRGADVQATDRDGKNALQRLMTNDEYWDADHDAVVSLLQKHGLKSDA